MSVDSVHSRAKTGAPASDWAPRLLIIDHYDSYTANLLTLLPAGVCATTIILQHTDERLADPARYALEVAPFIDAIIISPGPGSPENTSDFGTAARILQDCMRVVDDEDQITSLRLPVLGVCLGHQGIACAGGARLKRARLLQHGSQSSLQWSSADSGRFGGMGTDLFAGVPEGATVVRYNSLVVDEQTLPSFLRVTAWAMDPAPRTHVPSPSPQFLASYAGPQPAPNGLASTSLSTSSSLSIPEGEGERIVMGIQHASLPIFGVQFHPESIESTFGAQMMRNFLASAQEFWSRTGLAGPARSAALSRRRAWDTAQGLPHHLLPRGLQHQATSYKLDACIAANVHDRPQSAQSDVSSTSCPSSAASLANGSSLLALPNSSSTSITTVSVDSHSYQRSPPGSPPLDKLPAQHDSLLEGSQCRWRVVSQLFTTSPTEQLPTALDAPQIFDRLFRRQNASSVGSVWLDSARPHDPHSRYSYMASPRFMLSYTTTTRTVKVRSDQSASPDAGYGITLAPGTTFWDWLNQLQTDLQQRTSLAPTVLQDEVTLPNEGSPDSASVGIEEQDRDATVFKGGFTGYFGYEMKAESLGMEHATLGGSTTSDADFMFCDKVLCYDHIANRWTAYAVVSQDEAGWGTAGGASSSSQACLSSLAQVQRAISRPEKTLKNPKGDTLMCDTEVGAAAWFNTVSAVLHEIAAAGPQRAALFHASLHSQSLPTLHGDDTQRTYRDKVEMARKFIAAGESYELCITTAFRGKRAPIPPRASEAEADRDHFGLYCALRQKNAAPYSAYLQLPPIEGSASGPDGRGRAILSTSPERFMRVLRSGEVEMKPIKGTLARAGFAKGEEHMLPLTAGDAMLSPSERAEELRKGAWRQEQDLRRRAKLAADPKERGENLMIVDLIRADLLSFCHPSSVRVPKLMRVESYATIHQLVTTVRGQLRPGVSSVEALRRCFPPGSMTGAPKRRSVQILEHLEGHGRQRSEEYPGRRPQRGIYSGALGWLGVDGAADFAVVIRTAVAEGDDISVGAGGAVTFLSSANGELSEMLDKARSVGPISMST
ncbi:unnamed protein product [Tilletia controversa]|uniref:aminodeoxychorismate synthase n=3 Tax=Tilletia TaxID=13289 RepID=A0A8X7SUU0_9BASI|nr:hypothetical protein CF336_g5900 [Tilletia laevis]KAE8192072.1 hypothetical protein CF328_g5485 [Tilletia controversa]KAE8256347.1 hypothetical protein A4X03_0g5415 [Tilletia caries]KAE8194184.1 hypothetical protein CF335_g5405 [Tilletia laevis]KAE8242995.1 hypothetical protein A4X06_0g6625 [Tilletia controversa]